MAVEGPLLQRKQFRRGDEIALVVGVPDASVRTGAEARGTAQSVREQLVLAVRQHAYRPAVEAAPGPHDIAAGGVGAAGAVVHEVEREVVRPVLAAHWPVHVA